MNKRGLAQPIIAFILIMLALIAQTIHHDVINTSRGEVLIHPHTQTFDMKFIDERCTEDLVIKDLPLCVDESNGIYTNNCELAFNIHYHCYNK